MDFTKLSKDDLVKIAKVNDIRNYSKLKKDDFVDLVKKTKSLSIPEDVQSKLDKSTEKTTKKKVKKESDSPPKPKYEKLDKKLAKFVDLEQYKTEFEKYIKSEEVPSDDELLNIVSEKVAAFVDTINQEDHKKYVDAYGAVKLVIEYASKNKTAFSKLSEDQLYEKLCLFLYDKDENLHKALVEKMQKYIVKLKKADEKQKKTASGSASSSSSKKSKKTKKDENEEEEEEMSAEEEDQESEKEESDDE